MISQHPIWRSKSHLLFKCLFLLCFKVSLLLGLWNDFLCLFGSTAQYFFLSISRQAGKKYWFFHSVVLTEGSLLNWMVVTMSWYLPEQLVCISLFKSLGREDWNVSSLIFTYNITQLLVVYYFSLRASCFDKIFNEFEYFSSPRRLRYRWGPHSEAQKQALSGYSDYCAQLSLRFLHFIKPKSFHHHSSDLKYFISKILNEFSWNYRAAGFS